MASKNTLSELASIEANVVGSLTYEKKTIVTTKELDEIFKFLWKMESSFQHASHL